MTDNRCPSCRTPLYYHRLAEGEVCTDELITREFAQHVATNPQQYDATVRLFARHLLWAVDELERRERQETRR